MIIRTALFFVTAFSPAIVLILVNIDLEKTVFILIIVFFIVCCILSVRNIYLYEKPKLPPIPDAPPHYLDQFLREIKTESIIADGMQKEISILDWYKLSKVEQGLYRLNSKEIITESGEIEFESVGYVLIEKIIKNDRNGISLR